MRVIHEKQFDGLNLIPYQEYFIELWHSMTDTKSLDSYRIKCMNSRTIIRELKEEIDIGLIFRNHKEFTDLCAETKTILEADIICKKYYLKFLSNVIRLTNSIPNKNKDKDKNQDFENWLIQLRFVLADFHTELGRSYLTNLCNELKLLMQPNNEEHIKLVTSSLLSDLADRGWPLETLSGWPQNFLINPPSHTFDENLIFMLKILQSPPQEFEVTLRISKCANLPSIVNHVNFSFSSNPSLNTPNRPDILKFSTPHQALCFAKTTVKNVDYTSAAIVARDQLEQTVDLLRFGFESDKLLIDSVSHVKRIGDNKEEIILIPHSIPNPTDDSPYLSFTQFSHDLNSILDNQNIEQRSRRQLQAAIRQYRFGRDIDNYSDKFLYWWMGLEALARGDKGEIGDTVVHNVSRCMALVYLHQVLEDYLHTLQYCKIVWSSELARSSGVKDLNALSMEGILSLINNGQAETLLKQCKEHPILYYYGKSLIESLSDPKKTAKLISLHLDHLEWHLSRLWRIRCAIVHGSEIRFPLRLFTANLEYYIRQMILVLMSTFTNYSHILSIDEVFSRASINYEHLITILNDKNANIDSIRNAISNDVPMIANK